jgi:hypothetical protein
MKTAYPKTLAELAFACFLYNCFTNFNDTYLEFCEGTKQSPDFSDLDHIKKLLIWLNDWGCRQFALDYHDLASKEIKAWFESHKGELPSEGLCLRNMNEDDFAKAGKLYGSLMSKTASKKARNGRELTITVGPTGAAKILFAIRPNAFVPWDIPMRNGLGYGNSPADYTGYLKYIQSVLGIVNEFCKEKGFEITELPEKLGRKNSPVTMLIDEYLWIKLTRKCPLPEEKDFKCWASWS